MPTSVIPKLISVDLNGDQTALSSQFDSLVVLAKSSQDLDALSEKTTLMTAEQVSQWRSVDKQLGEGVQLFASENAPGGRVIVSGVGKMDREIDDVRVFQDATTAALKRAAKAGSQRPLIVFAPSFDVKGLDERYRECMSVSLLTALSQNYLPIQRRERDEAKNQPADAFQQIGVASQNSPLDELLLQQVHAMEFGRVVARDIGGADPERMAPLKVAEYVQESFAASNSVKVTVESDVDYLQKEYPLLMSVARASMCVPRHRPCVVRLEYRSPDQSQVKEHLYMVGKGVTFDTGGANIKTGGYMRGMSRDKCGAAAVAGFVASMDKMQNPHVNVTAYLALVRNSIGSEAYLCDEILPSRAGVNVLCANTDAEGRLAMADPLCKLREEVQRSTDTVPAHLITIATLTGHAVRCYGSYGALVPNAQAKRNGFAERLFNTAFQWGDPLELSMLRKEDFETIRTSPQGPADIVQGASHPGGMGARGHQSAMAFLMRVSGIWEACNGDQPVSYVHLDIAGSAEESGKTASDLPAVTGTPVVPLSALYVQ